MATKCALYAGGVRSFIEHTLAMLERDLMRADGSAAESVLAVLGDVQRALREIEERTVH
jgi:hypothetical protein